MSDLMIALLLQCLMLAVFASAIRSINKGQPGKGVTFVGFLFCTLFTGIFAGLNFPVLMELAPTVRTVVVESTVSATTAIKSVL